MLSRRIGGRILIRSTTIENIYDCATTPVNWQRALDSIVDEMGARAATLLVRDYKHSPWAVNHLSSVYVQLFAEGKGQEYVEKFAPYEERQWRAIDGQPVGAMRLDCDMGVARGELDRRADYVFLRQHTDVLRRLIVRLNDNNAWFDAIAVGFPSHVHEPDAAALASMRACFPHLAKAMEMSRAFSELERKYKAVLNALNRIRIGICLVHLSGQVVLVNSEAERIFAAGDGIRHTRLNTLACAEQDQTAELRAHIREIARTAIGRGASAQKHMALQRKSGQHPLLVEIVPIRDASDELNEQLRGAMLVVIDPDHSEDLNIGRFGDLYHLTKTEKEVCEVMVRGLSAPEIAERRGRSVATVRNQLKSIYAKTGTRSRAELIRLIVKTLPPIL